MNLPPQGLILNESSLQTVVNYFLTKDEFVFDVESIYDWREDPNRNNVAWISLATEGCAVVIPMAHPVGEENGTTKVTAYYKTGAKAGKPYNKTIKVFTEPPEQLDRATVFRILKPLFASTTIRKVGHDVIFDLLSSAKYLGFVPPPPYGCTKVGFWLLDENRFTRGLKEMTEERYGFKYDYEDVGECVEAHAFSLVAYYSFCDARFDYLHWLWIKEEMQAQNLWSIFNLEMEVLNTLIGMRMNGAAVDVKKIEKLRDELSAKLKIVEVEIYRAAGKKFNINSSQQKQDILYDPVSEGGQGLRPWKLTTGGEKARKAKLPLTKRHYSTDDTVLESFEGNPVADKLREYGDIDKILNTYVGSWLGDEDREAKIINGKIYARFLQYGTVTGRFSSSKPNLQNIPRSSTELGKLVKSVFVAEPGRQLICADYSQIELVVLAHYLEEGALYEGFLKGIDPHTMTAAMVLGKEPGDVTKDERQYYGKTFNFAIVYGAGIKKIATMARLTPREAKAILVKHEEMFPEIYSFKEAVIEYARKRKPEPYITTLLGRRRRVSNLNAKDEGIRMSAERQIFNSLIQGGAADIMKKAMVRVDAMLPDGCLVHLTVHDELVVSAPEDMVDKAVQAMYDGMTGPGIQKHLKVPLKIDLHTGYSWEEIK